MLRRSCFGVGSSASRRLLVVLAFTWGACAAPVAAREPLPDAWRALLSRVQGDAVRVSASPALCRALDGQTENEDPGSGAAPVSGGATVAQVEDWLRRSAPAGAGPAGREQELQRRYFSSGACRPVVNPPLDALVTRATLGLDSWADDPRNLTEAVRLLDAVAHRVAEEEDPLASRVSYSLLVELATGALSSSAVRVQPDGELASFGCRALAAADSLGARIATDSEDGLQDLAAWSYGRVAAAADAAGESRTAALAASLAAGESPSDVVEVTPVSTSHLEAHHGRFTARLLLHGGTPASRAGIADFLLGDRAVYERLGRLPITHGDVRAVLVLELNEPTPQDGWRPSGLVAFWQEVRFDGRQSLRAAELSQAEDRITFLTIRARLANVGETLGLAYEVASQSDIAHKSFVDLFPRDGAPATTLRGNCLRCHSRTLHSFHPQARRSVRLAPLRSRGDLAEEQPELLARLALRWQSWRRDCSAAEPTSRPVAEAVAESSTFGVEPSVHRER